MHTYGEVISRLARPDSLLAWKLSSFRNAILSRNPLSVVIGGPTVSMWVRERVGGPITRFYRQGHFSLTPWTPGRALRKNLIKKFAGLNIKGNQWHRNPLHARCTK
jgi:hypothetical protein